MIELKNVSHFFADKILYSDVNLKINSRDKIGLVGPNGAGKSTLIDIITGRISCSEGQIITHPKMQIGHLDQHIALDENMQIADYLKTAFSELFDEEKKYLTLLDSAGTAENPDKILNKANQILEHLLAKDFYNIDQEIAHVLKGVGLSSLNLSAPIKTLSGGQRAKLILCKLLLQKPDVLVLDEPTNHLDRGHIDWLANYLKNYEKAVLVVSHNTDFLNQVCTSIWSIEFSGIHSYSGNYQAFLRLHDERVQRQEKIHQAQEKKIKVLSDFIARNSARTSTARMAQSKKKQLEKIVLVTELKETLDPEYTFKFHPVKVTKVLEAQDFLVGYEKALFPAINLYLNLGEKISITGFNGVGKSTLLKSILGIIPSISGTKFLEEKLKIGYFEQNISWPNPSFTALEEIMQEFTDISEKEARRHLAKAGLSAQQLKQPIKTLSGGEQVKLKLCKFMMDSYNFLVLDEPTNHLDVKAKNALANAINNFAGSVIFVTHEKNFAEKINAKTIDLDNLKN